MQLYCARCGRQAGRGKKGIGHTGLSATARIVPVVVLGKFMLTAVDGLMSKLISNSIAVTALGDAVSKAEGAAWD